jgi:hypothetical protein
MSHLPNHKISRFIKDIKSVIDLNYEENDRWSNFYTTQNKLEIRKEIDKLNDEKRNKMLTILEVYNLNLELNKEIKWNGKNWSVRRPQYLIDKYKSYNNPATYGTFNDYNMANRYFIKWSKE